MSNEMLLQLYDEIKQCTSCSLSDLDINSFRINGKIGQRKVMIISQNPSCFKTAESIIMGGLDKLRNDELDRLLKNCYITNLVKCSFENNKVPDNIDSIVNHCLKWLESEINIIDPQLIIVLGRLAEEYVKIHIKYLNMADRRVIYMKHPLYHVYKGTTVGYINKLTKILQGVLD